MPTICICTNCSEQIGGKRPGDDAKCPQYCSDCGKKEHREMLGKEKQEIIQSSTQ